MNYIFLLFMNIENFKSLFIIIVVLSSYINYLMVFFLKSNTITYKFNIINSINQQTFLHISMKIEKELLKLRK